MPDPNNIPLVPVTSSQLAAVGHDPATSTLAVRFMQGGSLYHYQNVSPDDFAKLLGLNKKPDEPHSVGSYFIQNIKKKPDLFPFTRIEENQPKGEK